MKLLTSLTLLALLAACSTGAEPQTETSTPMPEHDDPEPVPEPVSPEPMEPEAATPDETIPEAADQEPTDSDKVVKTDEQWRALLSPLEYRVAREAGTERPFTGRYWDTTTAGTYKCIGCDTPLFRSDAKFESGCGWPSFFEPLEGAKLIELKDSSLYMARIEIRCDRCDAHLGHVFNDGPPPTGLRYCINSVSLMLDPDEKD